MRMHDFIDDMELCRAELRAMCRERYGTTAALRDVTCVLAEDKVHVMVFLNWETDDDPVYSSFRLSEPVTFSYDLRRLEAFFRRGETEH